MVSDGTLAGPFLDGLSHANLRVRLVGKFGYAAGGEVGREETGPLSDMGAKEKYPAQGDTCVTAGSGRAIDARTAC